MSIYFQIPESIDRDLILANSAIETFDELIKRFPDSEHIAEANQKRLECLKKLAEKELYITNFYLKKQRWDSALKRAEGLLNQHQGLGYEEKALARASLAARQVGQKELSERYQAQLRKDFPQSRESEEVSKTYLSF
jgi:outer membrane protein assembly factor BamD